MTDISYQFDRKKLSEINGSSTAYILMAQIPVICLAILSSLLNIRI
jgi:hypothetical protein